MKTGLYSIGYELCHPLPKRLRPCRASVRARHSERGWGPASCEKVNGETVGIEFADENARLAAEYMRAVIAEVYRQRTAVGA